MRYIINSKVNHRAQDVLREKHHKTVTKSLVPNRQAPPKYKKKEMKSLNYDPHA